MTATSQGTHPVGPAPTTVLIAIRFVIAHGISVVHTHAAADSHAGIGTGSQDRQHCPERSYRQASARGFHFGSTFVSLSVHSINPNGAPAGSATTASMPPWRSTRGSTRTRPPMATTL